MHTQRLIRSFPNFSAIDTAEVVAICVDQDYRDAAMSRTSKRNCKEEYLYAIKRKTDFVVPVIMDSASLDKDKWGLHLFKLSQFMHADLRSDDETAFEAGVDKIVREMVNKHKKKMEGRVKT